MFLSKRSVFSGNAPSSLPRGSQLFIRTIAGVALLAALPATSHAQVDMSGLMEQLSKQISESFTKMSNKRVLISPSLIVADVNKKTATIEFSNPTKDTLETEISAGLLPPAGMFGGGAPAKSAAAQNSALLADKPDSAADAKVDSINASQSLVSWIKDLPSSLKLAPGEKKSVTIKFDVPANAKPGEYSAWIVTSTKAKMSMSGDSGMGEGGITIKMSDASGKDAPAMKIQAGGKVVYRLEAAK